MHVQTILKIKGSDVVTVRPEVTIAALARLLDAKRIGIVVVCEDADDVIGVISERDIVRGIRDHGERVATMRVADLMTRNAAICTPDETVKQAIALMAERGVRHLPVVEDGKLRGLVSVGDMLKYLWQQAKLDEEALRTYIASVGYR